MSCINKVFFFKPATLFNQLLLSHLAIVFVSLLGIGGFTLLAIQTNSFNSLNYYLTIEARGINSNLIRKDLESLDTLSEKGFWVLVFDQVGKSIYTSIKINSKQSADIFFKISQKVANSGKSVSYKFYTQNKVKWYFVARPYFDEEGRIKGSIQIGLPLVVFNRSLGDSFYILFFLGLFLTIATVLVIYFLADWLSKPIKLVSSQATQIAKTGDLQVQLHEARSDEIGELAKSFNMMIKNLKEEKEFQKEFIANASHELKTPIMAICSAIEILQFTKKDSKEWEYFFEILIRQSNRVKELIDALLDISILESGKVKLNLTKFDVLPFIEECVKDIEIMAKKAQTDFSWYVDSSLIVTADRAKLRRALNNLLINAIKHTPVNGEVFLNVRLSESGSEREIIFSVQDTGIGISVKDQEKIFARFYRSDPDRSRETGGSGLGLAITQQIVSLHGGKLSVISEPGKGSEFRINIKT